MKFSKKNNKKLTTEFKILNNQIKSELIDEKKLPLEKLENHFVQKNDKIKK